MKSSSWQDKDIRGMIRTLTVNCAAILDCSKDDGKTPAETACDEMVLGAVRVLCEFSLLVSQQNHSDIALTAQDNALKRFHQTTGAFQGQKMTKSANTKLDEQLATESQQFQVPKIHKIRAAMEFLGYGAEKVATSTPRQFQVRLKSAQQVATK
jgi:hypothetical protein